MPTIVSCVCAVGQFWREAITHTQAITHAPFCPCLNGLPPTPSGSPLTSSFPLPFKLRAVQGLPLPEPVSQLSHARFCLCVSRCLPPTRSGSPLTRSIPLLVKLRAV